MELKEAIAHLDDILHNKEWDCEECKSEHIQLREYLAELHEYRKAILNNTLIKLPCKVGDTAWYYNYRDVKDKIFTMKVMWITIYDDDIALSVQNDIGEKWLVFASHIGKTVFLTREEAEKALKERENGNG